MTMILPLSALAELNTDKDLGEIEVERERVGDNALNVRLTRNVDQLASDRAAPASTASMALASYHQRAFVAPAPLPESASHPVRDLADGWNRHLQRTGRSSVCAEAK